jgi:hypothetical protein
MNGPHQYGQPMNRRQTGWNSKLLADDDLAGTLRGGRPGPVRHGLDFRNLASHTEAARRRVPLIPPERDRPNWIATVLASEAGAQTMGATLLWTTQI